MYPSSPNRVWRFKDFVVSPGDHVSAQVFRLADGTNWETRLDDLSTGRSGVMVTELGWGVMPDGAVSFPLQGTTHGLDYSGGYSAEWVVEDYSDASGDLVPLADFGSITFSNLTTSLSGWSLTPANSVTLVDADGNAIATPSVPTDGGFTVTYTGS
jgi:hypothetical protein